MAPPGRGRPPPCGHEPVGRSRLRPRTLHRALKGCFCFFLGGRGGAVLGFRMNQAAGFLLGIQEQHAGRVAARSVQDLVMVLQIYFNIRMMGSSAVLFAHAARNCAPPCEYRQVGLSGPAIMTPPSAGIVFCTLSCRFRVQRLKVLRVSGSESVEPLSSVAPQTCDLGTSRSASSTPRKETKP